MVCTELFNHEPSPRKTAGHVPASGRVAGSFNLPTCDSRTLHLSRCQPSICPDITWSTIHLSCCQPHTRFRCQHTLVTLSTVHLSCCQPHTCNAVNYTLVTLSTIHLSRFHPRTCHAVNCTAVTLSLTIHVSRCRPYTCHVVTRSTIHLSRCQPHACHADNTLVTLSTMHWSRCQPHTCHVVNHTLVAMFHCYMPNQHRKRGGDVKLTRICCVLCTAAAPGDKEDILIIPDDVVEAWDQEAPKVPLELQAHMHVNSAGKVRHVNSAGKVRHVNNAGKVRHVNSAGKVCHVNGLYWVVWLLIERRPGFFSVYGTI